MVKDDLDVEIGNIKLRNPTILAAGILGLTGASLERVWNSGAGAVVTKSVGKNSREGYSGPRIVETEFGLINAMGLPNPGIEDILEEIELARDSGATVIGSVFGSEPREFRELACQMEDAGVDAVELNLSCPHAENLSLIGRSEKLTEETVKAVKGLKIPIWVKLPGNTHIPNLTKVSKSAEKFGADALVLINTVPGMAIDATAKRPILGHKTGGLSGPAIKPIGLRLVYEIYEKVDIPIIGAGGVVDGEDMIEYTLAGASAVEIGTGILERDLDIFEGVCEEASQYLGKRKIEEIIGLAHQT